MHQQRRQAISVLLTLLTFACCALSQDGSNGVSVSLSANGNTFSRKADTRIKVKVVNDSRQTLSLDSRKAVTISLSTPRKYSDCHRLDCFSASFFLGHSREIKPGASLEIEVDLADLYWNDMISAVYDTRQPKNMFVEVPSGSYYLFITIVVPVKNSTGNRVNSNQLLVKVDESTSRK